MISVLSIRARTMRMRKYQMKKKKMMMMKKKSKKLHMPRAKRGHIGWKTTAKKKW